MIQSPSLSVLSMIPTAGDMPQPVLPEGAEMADFGALLALSANQAAPAATTIPGDAPATETPLAELASPAIPGKILPLAVPIAEPEDVVAKPKTDAPDPRDLPPPTSPLSKAGIPIQRVLVTDKDLPETGKVPVMDPLPPLPAAVQPVVPAAAIVPSLPGQLPVLEVPPESKAERPLPGSAAPQPAPAALAHANPRAVVLGAETQSPRQTEPGAPPPVQPAAAQSAAAPQPVAQVRVELAPVPPVMRALPKDELRPAPTATLPELPVASVTTVNVPAAPAAAAVPLVQQTMPLENRPHDFSALIDRLVAAREAAAPQGVAVNVAHAEFGQVHLRFRQDDAGLSVAMTSADPAFARAASAMPPVLPVSDAQAGQFQSGQRQDSSAASSQSGTGQQRGSTGERQGDQPHSNHTPRHAQSAKPQRRAGIFA